MFVAAGGMVAEMMVNATGGLLPSDVASGSVFTEPVGSGKSVG